MILTVDNVNKSFGKEKILKEVTFKIERPSIIALVGPNGSGKSTLLSIITNLQRADSGEISILDKENTDVSLFREVSFMQDNTVLYDYLTGYDHMQFIADVQSLSKSQIVETAERIGITRYLNKRIGKYSLGMKQHLLLAMAILNKPKLLILDEPLNGLDPTSAIKVRNLLLELHKEGTSVLLSSHNLSEIDRITSEILFLKKGAIIKEDISQYERICYHLTVNDVSDAHKQLTKELYEVEIISNQKISLFLKDTPLHIPLSLLMQSGTKIVEMEKIIFGSEDRYQNIFGEKDADHEDIPI
ncbi:ABC transporter ATP-binding protein [Sutcliffiella horikoshii]|uniref:ABC transporter ATP-binding protein n=1 Tax=Sutcliffiella horikoshii TaxID=79883 RepID=A0ABM6KMB6_9BACI|nr:MULTISPECIES: ABC transporter ATP-binding protein [Bacillaceae]ART77595.1 ABC transporter ATP-binding protein [Sutcliffiella horikoshii]NMH74553.1 ABC transporter ATP-binding protein [Bacillus sp. RO2]